ncbi:MAG TPA: beta-glucosidase, partial [Sphingobacterium sp.]|nr:beta-glucosidase [Sphingobacterium sp.]
MRKRIAYPALSGIALALILSSSCQNTTTSSPESSSKIDSTSGSKINEDSLLTTIQQHTFQYFWEGAEPTSGLARERIHMDGVYTQNDRNVVTIGGSGFGLMGMIVAMERGFISQEQGIQKLNHIMDYLGKIERFKGAWAHWYDGELGTAKPFSEKDNGGDIVETAFLAQGLIAIREYLKDKGDSAQLIAQKADKLWKEINWNHYTNGQNVIYWHWSPKFNFQQNHPVRGYDECLITYILAASSPTYPIAP